MTPVAVSKDQSLEAESVIHGSVRSFVKYFKIRETSTYSKSNDSTPVVSKTSMNELSSDYENFESQKDPSKRIV